MATKYWKQISVADLDPAAGDKMLVGAFRPADAFVSALQSLTLDAQTATAKSRLVANCFRKAFPLATRRLQNAQPNPANLPRETEFRSQPKRSKKRVKLAAKSQKLGRGARRKSVGPRKKSKA